MAASRGSGGNIGSGKNKGSGGNRGSHPGQQRELAKIISCVFFLQIYSYIASYVGPMQTGFLMMFQKVMSEKKHHRSRKNRNPLLAPLIFDVGICIFNFLKAFS